MLDVINTLTHMSRMNCHTFFNQKNLSFIKIAFKIPYIVDVALFAGAFLPHQMEIKIRNLNGILMEIESRVTRHNRVVIKSKAIDLFRL